uniref:Uncharacterized protein n=1 Tax=Alexandrium catenella TaxID=2925 RepID=A0A7S1L3F7_ALECA|mmetsp:Transcript_105624/g.281333  ORF Transcript_105624/g.281333 Transcript_105624/m.281333 type:complete len:337 (+) Transcript_105624:74-1084(+)
MFEFLRESLLCSSDDSPKCEPNPRRRPGEIISSQGSCVQPPPPREPLSVPKPLWERQRPRRCNSRTNCNRLRRTPSPLPGRWSASGSPCSSFCTAPSFREALGGSLAYTGAAAAQQEEPLPGRGLYVAMQRGLEPRGTSRSSRNMGLRARSPQPVDDEEACGGSRSGSFLQRHPDASVAVGSTCMAATGGSFEQREAIRPTPSMAGLPPFPSGNGSFLLGAEPCGLLPGRDGSFYAVPNRGDPRLEAMRAAGAPQPPMQQPLPQPPPGQMLCAAPPPPVFVASQGVATPQRAGMCTPGVPASRMPPPMVQRQQMMGQMGPFVGPACFTPALLAVHG